MTNSQKSFSKLRGAIGGVYAWRVDNFSSPDEQKRVIKEADFAYKQAFAFCPSSPEAVIRYNQLPGKSWARCGCGGMLQKPAPAFDDENIHIIDLARQLRQLTANPSRNSATRG
jgi:hypothetical protein